MEFTTNTQSNSSIVDLMGIMPVDNGSVLSLPTVGVDSTDSFFDIYYSKHRFVVESVLAVLAFLINCLALLSSAHARNKRYNIYHILFINLCVCNALSLSLTWLSNNTIFIFSDSLTRLTEQDTGLCKVFVYLTAAVFVCSAFSTVSILTLLGFIIVQYIAICHPLEHLALVRKKRVAVFLILAWLITILGGCIPFFTLLYLSEHCDALMLRLIFRVVTIGANCFIGFMALVYTLVFLICIRIYLEVRQLQKRLSQFRYDQEVQGESKAFFTTLMLIGLLTVFYVPYTTVYVFSMNNAASTEIHSSALIYYMNLLPYVKFFLDPIIYGLRMKEMRDGCVRMAFLCGCCNCVSDGSVNITRCSININRQGQSNRSSPIIHSNTKLKRTRSNPILRQSEPSNTQYSVISTSKISVSSPQLPVEVI